MTKQSAFKPEEHFRNLKGQQYLEVKWRVVWFREEHGDGYVRTEMVEHDPAGGLAVFKAQVGYLQPDGKDVYATSYGSETRKDFADYLEKAETKAIGRALAMLGYGTAQAAELDEGERIVDSPVDRKQATEKKGDYERSHDEATAKAQSTRASLAMVPQPVDIGALRTQVEQAMLADQEAAARLPKPAHEMNEEELTKTLAWMTRRARALSS